MEIIGSSRPTNIKDLRMEANGLKLEIKHLKDHQNNTDKKIVNFGLQISNLLKEKYKNLEEGPEIQEEERIPNLFLINQIPYQK